MSVLADQTQPPPLPDLSQAALEREREHREAVARQLLATPDEVEPSNNEQVDSEEVFLACFYQIAKDSLSRKRFEAIEDAARALARDYQKMHRSC